MQRQLHSTYINIIDSAVNSDLEMFHTIATEDAINALKFILNTPMMDKTNTAYAKLPPEFCTEKFQNVQASIEILYRVMQNRQPQNKIRSHPKKGPEIYHGIFGLEAWLVKDYPVNAELVRDYLKKKLNLKILLLKFIDSVSEPYFQREDKQHEKTLLVKWVSENKIEMPETVKDLIKLFDIKAFIQEVDPSSLTESDDLLKELLELPYPQYLSRDIELVKTIWDISPIADENVDAYLHNTALSHIKEKIKSFFSTNNASLFEFFVIAEKAYQILYRNKTLLIHHFERKQLTELENKIKDFFSHIEHLDSIEESTKKDLQLFIAQANTYLEEENISLIELIFSKYFTTNVQEEKNILYKSLIELHCEHNKIIINDNWLKELKSNTPDKKSNIPVLDYYHVNRIILHACFIPKNQWSPLFYEFFSSCVNILNSTSVYNELSPQLQKTAYPQAFINQLITMLDKDTERKEEQNDIFPLFYSQDSLKLKVNYLSSKELSDLPDTQKIELIENLLDAEEKIQPNVLQTLFSNPTIYKISLINTLISHFEVIDYFFSQIKIFCSYTKEELGDFVLHLVLHNEREWAKQLLKLQPHLDKKFRFISNGHTALHICMTRAIDDVDLVLALYQMNPNFNMTDLEENTPLMLGIQCKNEVLLSKLCLKDDFISKHTPGELSKIIPLLLDSHFESAQYLYERKYKVLDGLTDDLQKTFLQKLYAKYDFLTSAIKNNKFELVEFLIQKIRLSVYSDDQLGEILYYLIHKNKLELAKTLIEERPTINKNWQEEKNQWTPLHLCMGGCYRYTYTLEELILLLHKNNFHFEIKDKDGNIPLMLAIKNESRTLLYHLCQRDEFPEYYSSRLLSQVLTVLLSSSDFYKKYTWHFWSSFDVLFSAKETMHYLHDAEYEIMSTHFKSAGINKPTLTTDKINDIFFWWFSQKGPLPKRHHLSKFFSPDIPLSTKKMENNTTLLREAVLNDHANATQYFIQNNMLIHYSDLELGECFLYLIQQHRAELALLLIDYRPTINIDCLLKIPQNQIISINEILQKKYHKDYMYGIEIFILTAARRKKFHLLKNICERMPVLISHHSIQSLIIIAMELIKYKQLILFQRICNINIRLKEAAMTAQLFQFPHLEESPTMTPLQIENALKKIDRNKINVLYLIIFLRTFFNSFKSNLKLYDKPPYYHMGLLILKKIISGQQSGNFPMELEETRFLYEISKSNQLLLGKIINKFIDVEALISVKKLIMQDKREECGCKIS